MKFTFCTLILIQYRIFGSASSICETGGLEPQLSTTFLDGYWYEHLSVNSVLKYNPCAHYEIDCSNENKSCEMYYVMWKSYRLIYLWNATLTQNDTEVIMTMKINDTEIVYSGVNLKFQDDSAVLWVCDESDILFASVVFRMDTGDQMDKIWNEYVKNTKYPSIAEEFPAGIWIRNQPRPCLNGGKILYPNLFTITMMIFVFNFITK